MEHVNAHMEGVCAPKLVWGWLLECLDVVVGVHVNNFGLKKAGVAC